MKKLNYAFLATLVTFIMLFSTVNSVVAQEGHENHMGMEDMCHDEDMMVAIATDDSQLNFNTTEVKVEKGACVMVHFMNTQPTEHDFVVNHANGTEWFGLHLAEAGMMVLKVPMPNEDTELEFYCSVTGHKDAGMYGTIIVGEGNSSALPGFEIVQTLLFFAVTIPILRKFNQKYNN